MPGNGHESSHSSVSLSVLATGTSPWSPRNCPYPHCCCGGRKTSPFSRGWWKPLAGTLCRAGWRATSCQAVGTGSHRAILRRCISTCGPSCKTCWASSPCLLAQQVHDMHIRVLVFGESIQCVHAGWTPSTSAASDSRVAHRSICGPLASRIAQAFSCMSNHSL